MSFTQFSATNEIFFYFWTRIFKKISNTLLFWIDWTDQRKILTLVITSYTM